MGYDAVLLGRADDVPIDVDRIHARLRKSDNERVARSLQQVGFYSAVELLGTYAGDAADLSDWLQGAAINDDRNLRLQYLAGKGLNEYNADVIFDNMTSGGLRIPAALFAGSPQRLNELRRIIQTRHDRFSSDN